MVKYTGLGQHVQVVFLEDPSTNPLFGQLETAFGIVNGLSATFSRLVIITLYLRIFNTKPYRIACYILIGVLAGYDALTAILTLTQCIPLSALWDQTIENPRCFDIFAWWRWCTFPSVLTDLAMLILPIPVILNLKLSRRDKLGLLLTFSTGSM